PARVRRPSNRQAAAVDRAAKGGDDARLPSAVARRACLPPPRRPPSRLNAAQSPAPAALVLTGGGARAAYQVGVLLGIRRVLLAAGWPSHANPFQVFSGTSAGAINATVLAAGADRFFDAVAKLALVWGTIEPAQVYRVDTGGALGN